MPSRLRIVLALGSAQTLAWGSTYYLPAILAEPMASELGISTGNVFAAFSLALIVTAVLGPLSGKRIDHHGGRDVLALSSIIFAVGLAVLGMASGPLMLWLGWLVIGIGMALGLYESAFSTLTGIFGRDARGAITGITLLAGFASTICWPISGWLNAEYGWRATCLTWAGVHLLLGLPLNRLLIPVGVQRAMSPAERSQANGRPGSGLTMALLAFVFAATWFTSTAMAAHMPRLLQESGLSAAAAIGVLAGAPATTAFVLLHGGGNGILTIAKGTLPLALFGPHGYGLRQGLLMVPARFAQAFAPFVFALLIDDFGTGALWLSAALGVLAYVALSLLQRTAQGLG
ncbi:MAG: MFS transporter [Gammaproteobacteria bacterium HGW-Gammaproteobacteria-9]|nr:MAG: MFS transporter [Gammaproteobacteria bacterium HGW-Gammaproteobacteria-9]